MKLLMMLLMSVLTLHEPPILPPEPPKVSKEVCTYKLNKVMKTFDIYDKDSDSLVLTQERLNRRIRGNGVIKAEEVASLHCDAYLALDEINFKLYLRVITIKYTSEEIRMLETQLYGAKL